MPHRYKNSFDESSSLISFELKPKPVKLASALHERLKTPYKISDFAADLMSGSVVGLVALPLAMALAIASGVSPQQGLYTVMIAGFVVALLGGSRLQVTGPTAAFVVVLVPIVAKYGLAGLLVSGLMAGILLMLMGLFRLGRLIEFIPYPVTTGFTTGIAVVIGLIQLKDFFGLDFPSMPENFIQRIEFLASSLPHLRVSETFLALATLGLLFLWPSSWMKRWTKSLNKKIPGPLIALATMTLGALVLKKFWPEFSYASIHDRFHFQKGAEILSGIPQSLPQFMWPWDQPGPGGQTFELSLQMIEKILPSSFAVAMLGAIESLLSAVVADGMAKTKHDPDAELFALGVGNVLCPFFGGIPATGAIARTATNIRFGAQSPFSAMVHALFVLLVVLLCAPYVSYLPMAALAALLIFVAYNMAEIKTFKQILKVAPRSDVAVLLICFFLTVVFDMVIGVSAGMVLASFLFMARMSSMTRAELFTVDTHPHLLEKLPKHILLYQIAGPLFFGAAQKAIEALSRVADDIRIVVFDLSAVPTMDVTGLVALENCIESLKSRNKVAVITGLSRQPASVILRSPLMKDTKHLYVIETLDEALKLSRDLKF